jgi:hypothetical protein
MGRKSGVMPPHSKAVGRAWFVLIRFWSRPQKQMASQKLCGIGLKPALPGSILGAGMNQHGTIAVAYIRHQV